MVIAIVATLVTIAVIDSGDLMPAHAARGEAGLTVSPIAPPEAPALVGLRPDVDWGADESRSGTRPDAAH